MQKKKQSHTALVFIAISLLFIVNSVFSKEKSIKPDYIYGKVVYSDNNTPVNSGYVKVIISKGYKDEGKIIELVEIQPGGNFRLSNGILYQSDGYEIMAYRNDLDNNGNSFEPLILDIHKAMKNFDETSAIILRVKRFQSNELEN